ncbi:MAG: transposase, partial [Phaeodactylibacter sp.]|nr:transposase [Phaeodactylibacter sp.]
DNRLLGAKTGATMVLHTWGQNLSLHPHVHCIVPGGGLTAQGRWQQPKKAGKRGFLFPVRAMSQVFKAFYLKHFMAVWNKGLLTIPPDAPTGYPEAARWRQARWSQDWVVYAKAPFNGPQTVIEYLGRYTHKVAISNHRLVDITPQQVIFRYKDYRREAKVGLMVLDGVEFLRRFCLHILPPGFRRLRHYGILANFHKAHALQAARSSLGVSEELMPPKLDKATLKAGLLARWFDHRTTFCPHCGAHNTIVRMLLAPNSARAPPIRSAPVSNITH